MKVYKLAGVVTSRCSGKERRVLGGGGGAVKSSHTQNE